MGDKFIALFESFLNENKNAIINKIPALSAEQKTEVINYFLKHSNAESKINWNSYKTLSYDDFSKVMDVVSKTGRAKAVKTSGIGGLAKGKDYLEFSVPNGEGWIPLNYETSKAIASKSIGGCEGKWCTAYQKTTQYWDGYTNKGLVLIYILIGGQKYAVTYSEKIKGIEIYDQNDKKINKIPDIDIRNVISENKTVIDKAQKILDNDPVRLSHKLNEEIKNNDITVIKDLIGRGAKPDAESLYKAISLKNIDIIKYILASGAPLIKGQGSLGRTAALARAVATKDLDTVKYIVSLGAKPTISDLNDAIELNNMPIAEYFVSLGVTPSEFTIKYAKKPKMIAYVKSLSK